VGAAKHALGSTELAELNTFGCHECGVNGGRLGERQTPSAEARNAVDTAVRVGSPPGRGHAGAVTPDTATPEVSASLASWGPWAGLCCLW